MRHIKVEFLRFTVSCPRFIRGQALIEVLVAISVLTMGFLGVVTLLSRALSLNRVIGDNYTATYLATEGIEVVKNIIDGNVRQGVAWNDGIRNCSYEVDYESVAVGTCRIEPRALEFDASSRLYRYDASIPTTFRREIAIELLSANEMRVNSKVTWESRGGGSFNVNLEDHFFNWLP